MYKDANDKYQDILDILKEKNPQKYVKRYEDLTEMLMNWQKMGNGEFYPRPTAEQQKQRENIIKLSHRDLEPVKNELKDIEQDPTFYVLDSERVEQISCMYALYWDYLDTWERLNNEEETNRNDLIELDREENSTDKGNFLPVEFTENNPQIRKYIDMAINCGMIKRTSTGGEWIYKGNTKTGKARLGYFCFKAFKEPRPQKAIQNYFGIDDISPNITNASMEVKRGDAIRWRKEIDDKIFKDL